MQRIDQYPSLCKRKNSHYGLLAFKIELIILCIFAHNL